MACKKRKEEFEIMESYGRGGFWGFSFLRNTKSSYFGELKKYIGEGG